MKTLISTLFIGLMIAGCTKDKIQPIQTVNPSYYQSDGNVLLLIVGDSLDAAYEYDLPIVQLTNDSLSFSIESSPDPTGMFDFNYWKFQPNSDTLFWTQAITHTFMEDKINSNELFSLNTSIPFDSTQFQVIESNVNAVLADEWAKIANLEIVRTYREALPSSKIGISRQIVYVHDEQLNFSIPVEKHFFFLVK